MKKSEFEKKVSKILEEEETFMLSLILLSHLHNDEKYKELSDLIFLFDNYSGFKRFIKYYEGQSIQVPTVIELKQTLKLLTLFQKVYIDKKDFEESYHKLNLASLGLTREYCNEQIEYFKKYLQSEGSSTLSKIRRISKKFK